MKRIKLFLTQKTPVLMVSPSGNLSIRFAEKVLKEIVKTAFSKNPSTHEMFESYLMEEFSSLIRDTGLQNAKPVIMLFGKEYYIRFKLQDKKFFDNIHTEGFKSECEFHGVLQ